LVAFSVASDRLYELTLSLPLSLCRAVELFDFDCNLTHDDLRADVDALLARSAQVGVTEMLVPGATLDESAAAIALCEQLPAVRTVSSLMLVPSLTTYL
jgi:hypothetical protein